jgi:hypothetical protein
MTSRGRSSAEDHSVPVVRHRSRRGSDLLLLRVQECADRGGLPVRGWGTPTCGLGHDGGIRA